MSDTVIKMNSISKKIRNTVILNDLNMKFMKMIFMDLLDKMVLENLQL